MISLRRFFVWSATVALIALASSTLAQDKHTQIVRAPAGAVQGQIEGDLRVFKGIPFALPPVGERRWRTPSPMPQWAGVREATEYGAACWQPKPTLSTIYTR